MIRKIWDKRESGFTIMEVMIAIVILGFLFTMVAQIMNGEIRMMNTANRQSQVEQKARTAMVHLLDQVKTNRYTCYDPSLDSVYSQVPGEPIKYHIVLNPTEDALDDPSQLPEGTVIYYDRDAGELWYRKKDTNAVYLIADDIVEINMFAETNRLLRVYLKAQDSSGNEYELLTWTRMY